VEKKFKPSFPDVTVLSLDIGGLGEMPIRDTQRINMRWVEKVGA